MKYVVRGTKVIVKQEEALEQSGGGIYIPTTSQERPRKGIVVAVGENADKALDGKAVLYETWAGTLVELDGNEYLAMDQDDILIILG